MARRSLLNVKSNIERTITVCQALIDENYLRLDGGVRLPPAFEDEIRSIIFLSKAILRKHAAKQTCKDISL